MGCVVVALCKVFWRGSGVGALERLACCVKVLGDIEVETGPELNLFGDNFFS